MSRIAAALAAVSLTCLPMAALQGAPLALAPPSAAQALAAFMAERNAISERATPAASAEQLRQVAAGLEQLRARLERQPYLDYARAEPYMYVERLNIGFPLAQVYARLGDNEQALQALERTTGVVLDAAFVPALDDPVFAALKDAPRFQAVAAKYRQGALTSRSSFATPYTPTLTRAQRIAGLSLFWSEVRHNFANPDLAPGLDWDAVYLDYLARVEQAATTADYYRVLMQLAPLLHDGHTNIYPPREVAARWFARAPLETALVEDAVVVVAVRDASLRQRIAPGERITAVDGIEVKQYARQFVQPYVSSSTAQDRDVRMFDYQLLAGDASKPVRLTVASRTGVLRTVEVARSGRGEAAAPPFAFQVLPNGVAYLRLDHFESDAAVKAFEQALPRIRAARGLILDVRANGGGSTGFGMQILAYLTERPIVPMTSRVRSEDQALRAQRGDFVSWRLLGADAPPVPGVAPADVWRGPVALLIGPKTFSAAEDFAALFTQARRGILVGEASAGSTGQPLMLQLPGGGAARLCVKRDTYADGSDFVGKGVQPTVTVKPTLASVRAGTDPVLAEAARLLLRPEMIAPPGRAAVTMAP